MSHGLETGGMLGFFGRFIGANAKLALSVEKRELVLGEEVKGNLGIQAREELDIEGISLSLICVESIKKTKGYTRTTHYENGEGTERWKKEEYWDEETLHRETKKISGPMHVYVGFAGVFSFTFKLPTNGRETYHGVDRNLKWLLTATSTVSGKVLFARFIRGRMEVLVSKSSTAPAVLKETIKEVVLIPCKYCGGLMPQTSLFCPNCGARRTA